jgi:hypothetical protein
MTLNVTSIVSAFLSYMWAGAYSYYRQLEQTSTDVLAGDTAPQILAYDKPPGEETIISAEEIRNSYAQIELNMQQYHPQSV